MAQKRSRPDQWASSGLTLRGPSGSPRLTTQEFGFNRAEERAVILGHATAAADLIESTDTLLVTILPLKIKPTTLLMIVKRAPMLPLTARSALWLIAEKFCISAADMGKSIKV